jgi:hypothetical protein
MKLAAAQSLTAWLWQQQPEIVYQLARQVPGALGQCFSCDIDLLMPTSTCDASSLSSISCLNISLDASSLDPDNLDISDGSGLDGGLACIPTITEADLTPVDTSAVTGVCNVNVCDATTSVANTDAATSSSLSGVANFLTSSAGLSALAKVASSYFTAQAAASNASAAASKAAAAQATVVAAQTARAVAGQTALPIVTVANGATGSTSQVISTTSGLLPLTSSVLSSLTPSSVEVFLAQYGNWFLIGGAVAVLAYAATRRRSAT